jgi:iron complex transport system substrate-binding protein
MRTAAGISLAVILVAVILLAGCIRSGVTGKEPSGQDPQNGNRYSTRFTVRLAGDYRLLQVLDPWQNSKGVAFSYVLGSRNGSIPDSLADYPFIPVPVNRVIAMSTTHVAMISQLGKSGTIVGASGTELIYDRQVRQNIENGWVQEVGYDNGLNYETIVKLEPDVVFMYGVEGSVTTISRKLNELGIRVVYCAEYLEDHPLGKAEWIRFIAQFFNLESESDRFFDRVDSAYRKMVELTGAVEDRPKVLTGLPWKDTWFMAGGKSYASRLINDAGGDFLWSGNSSTEVIPLDLESVFSRAVLADVWINPGNASSLDDLVRFDPRFKELPVVQQGSVFNNNARMSAGGGNDYWETGTVRPDLVLADLIMVFHPDLLEGHSLYYYRKLK